MHPTSRLQALTVADALRDSVVTITTDQTLEEAARTMRDRGVTALAVIDLDSRGDPGIITEADIGRAMAADADPRRQMVGDFRTADVIAATSDWTLERAARTMTRGHFRHLMVVEQRKVIGILSMSDVVAAWTAESAGAPPAVPDETGEISAIGPAHQYLYSLRRSAKQHMVAAKCPCEWEWYRVLEGQLEDRPDLDENTLRHLWERREPCPALHAAGGGAD
jgi:signal-transduction protein with cAMP-binding, CBS, and nucleotidyltransferase domain